MAGKFYKSFELQQVSNAVDEKLEIEEIKKTDGKLVRWLKSKTFKGFKGHSLYTVGKYFIRAIFKESVMLRASSLSFNFTLSIFPSIIFLLTLIAYLPVKGIKTRLILELGKILPKSTFETMSSTINEIVNIQNGGLLSLGFLLAIYFASNAFHSLINSFSRTLVDKVRKSWIRNRLKAIFITFIIGSLIIVALILLTWMVQFNVFMLKNGWMKRSSLHLLFSVVEYIVLISLIFTSFSCIYYFTPNKESKWKFFTAGSIFAGGLSIVSTFIFSLYVNNFGAYNKIYGSIGAIIALMVLVYINVNVLLAGFELNNSIDKASLEAEREIVE